MQDSGLFVVLLICLFLLALLGVRNAFKAAHRRRFARENPLADEDLVRLRRHEAAVRDRARPLTATLPLPPRKASPMTTKREAELLEGLRVALRYVDAETCGAPEGTVRGLHRLVEARGELPPFPGLLNDNQTPELVRPAGAAAYARGLTRSVPHVDEAYVPAGELAQLRHFAEEVRPHAEAWVGLLERHVALLPEDGPLGSGEADRSYAQHELRAMRRALRAIPLRAAAPAAEGPAEALLESARQVAKVLGELREHEASAELSADMALGAPAWEPWHAARERLTRALDEALKLILRLADDEATTPTEAEEGEEGCSTC